MQSPSASPPRWNQRRAASFVFPLLLVVVGVVLLLNNAGILPWTIWTALGQLWPVILILFGLDLLLGRRNAWLGASVAMVALIAVLGLALWMTYSGVGLATAASVSQGQNTSVPLGDATSGQVTVQFGAGTLNLGAPPTDQANLAEASASLPTGIHLSRTAVRHGGTSDVTFSTEGAPNFWPFRGFNRNHQDMNLGVLLSPKIPLTVRADVGAGQSNFDLSSLMVHDFTLNNGAGEATVAFPTSAGQTTADIHSGAGRLVLVIPDGVGAVIHTNNGLVNMHVPSDRFQKVGENYQTADYGTSANRLDLTLHVGIGEVDVQ